ncbi:RNA polymerase sigma factor [Prosthecobacter dejongeii]|uniref:RNA polymerase sigma-70 factor (ECF subfamily) n=1 Tax=Prosthecobacter dejongeii TaxID=48465 RepID=A0A7W7YKN1_9BACT|nr:sigma-70 family RNA polymerase sigma factor [Prosthecobacter dejongeii]MBB5037737.1 RNA polymerase sigma-70 factor (ECF subfamily) [Prosthecobacter dejongeii]
MVLRASDLESQAAQRDMEHLCRACWYPIYAFVRRQGYSPEDAQDLAQGFFVHVLENNVLAHADPERGRFRSFLLGALRHFVSNEARKQRTEKRGGRVTFVPLDANDDEERFDRELAHPDSPEKLFERNWAENLLQRAVKALEADYVNAGKLHLFTALQPYLAGSANPNSYEELAKTLGMSTGTIAVSVYRMRRRYGELLREEIAQTVENPADIEQEIRMLLEAVAS